MKLTTKIAISETIDETKPCHGQEEQYDRHCQNQFGLNRLKGVVTTQVWSALTL